MEAAVQIRRRRNQRRQEHVRRPTEDANGNDEATPETLTGSGVHRGQPEATGDQEQAIEGENGQSSSRRRSRDSDQDDEAESLGPQPDAQEESTEGGEGRQPSSRKRSRESEHDDEGETEEPDAQKGPMEDEGEQSRTPEEERRPPCEVLAEKLAEWREVARGEAQVDFAPLQEGYEMFQETAFLAIASVMEAIAAAGGPAFALLDPVLTGIPHVAQRVLRPRHTVLYPAHGGGAFGRGGGHLSLYIIRGVGPEGAHSGNATRFQVEAHDSFAPTRNAALQGRAFRATRQLLEYGGWTGHEFGDPENDALFANRIVAGDGVADQRAGWNCGFHTVLNAWAHALNLQTVAAGVRLGGRFNALSVEMVNLAMQGFMDSTTIEAFFLCFGYVAADQRVPLNRRFERTQPFRRMEELQRFLAEQRLEEDLQRHREFALEAGDEERIPDLNEALYVMRMTDLEPADLTAMGIDQFLHEYRLARGIWNVYNVFSDGPGNAEPQQNAGLNGEEALNTAIDASLRNGFGPRQGNRPSSVRPDQHSNQPRPSSERAGRGAPQPSVQGNANGATQPRRNLENGDRATNPPENDDRPHRNPSLSNDGERQSGRRRVAWAGVATAMADLSALDDAALERLREILAIGIQDVASERARRAELASDQPAASQGASRRQRRTSGQGSLPSASRSNSADSNLNATLLHLSQQEGWASRLDGEHRFRRRSQGPDASPLGSRRRTPGTGQTRGHRYPERSRRLRFGRGAGMNRHSPTGAGPAGGWPSPRSVLQDEWWQVWEPQEPDEWMVWLRRELDWARSREPPRRRADGSRAHPLEGDPLLRREHMETSSPE
ncbi:hypothetical protein KC316_g412 [Hortaea werneckii]|nr:hypothetical protein KC324_g479 [Hortaea werneckii]KAI7595614.1 hypothetical protein KC316_g412 [Hortaea werneckii]